MQRARAEWFDAAFTAGELVIIMPPQEALHTAARRYCLARSQDLRDQYRRFNSWGMEDNELLLTGRRAGVQAILTAIEVLVPSAYTQNSAMVDDLIAAGNSAESSITQSELWRASPIQNAFHDEHVRFARAVRDFAALETLEVEALPFRRTVLAEERAVLWERLKPRWKVGGRWWLPWEKIDLEEEAVVLDTSALHDALGASGLQEILVSHDVACVYELWDSHGIDLELALPLFDIFNANEERYWFSEAMDWLTYTTHEGSVAIAGPWLLAEIKSKWPMWADHPYIPYVAPAVEPIPPEPVEARRANPSVSTLPYRFMAMVGGSKLDQMAALLDAGVDINVQISSHGTALHNAAGRGNEECMRFLLERGADPNMRAARGITPLMCAVSNGHIGVARLLLVTGADVNARAGDAPEAGPRAGLTAHGIATASEYLEALEPRRRDELIALLVAAEAQAGHGRTNETP